jgi:hypothetical protein
VCAGGPAGQECLSAAVAVGKESRVCLRPLQDTAKPLMLGVPQNQHTQERMCPAATPEHHNVLAAAQTKTGAAVSPAAVKELQEGTQVALLPCCCLCTRCEKPGKCMGRPHAATTNSHTKPTHPPPPCGAHLLLTQHTCSRHMPCKPHMQAWSVFR